MPQTTIDNYIKQIYYKQLLLPTLRAEEENMTVPVCPDCGATIHGNQGQCPECGGDLGTGYDPYQPQQMQIQQPKIVVALPDKMNPVEIMPKRQPPQ